MKLVTVKMHWGEGAWHSELIDAEFACTLESTSYDTLVERVKVAVQDIYEVDFKYSGDIQFFFQSERVDNLRAQAS